MNGVVDLIQGDLNVVGGGDTGDQLNVDDTGSIGAKTGTLTSSTLTGLGLGGTITYTTFADLNVNLGQAGDTFTIMSTHAGRTRVEGRGGSDTINVRTIAGATTVIGDGSTTTISYGGNIVSTGVGDDLIQVGSNAGVGGRNFEGVLSGIVGHLTLDGAVENGPVGVDRLSVDDSGDLVARTGRLDGTTINGLGMASGITYTRFEALHVMLGTENDTFHVASTHLGTTRISGGPGADVISVEQVLGGTQIEGDDPVVAPSETFTADGWVNVHTHRVLDGVTPITVTVNGVAVPFTYSYGDNTINFAGAVTGTVVVSYGGSPGAFARTTPIAGGQDHILVNVTGAAADGSGLETHSNGVGAYLAIDGQQASDLTSVYLAGTAFSAGHPISTIDVHDSGAPTDTNKLDIYGTDDELISDNFLVRRNFVALLPTTTATAERINYDFTLNRGVQIFGRKGDDRFALDDNSTILTIDGGQGDDSFQIGQMFPSSRIPAQIPLDRADDSFATVETTRGFLSNGISLDTTINGGQGADRFTVFHNGANLILNGDSGNDSFTVRAFALRGSTAIDPNQHTTSVFGGLGNDYVEYTENAPVAIDGGAGTDTVHVIGTEFSDTFVITNQGVYGAGLFVQYVGIEVLNVDGLEGNDRFVVYSTDAYLSTSIYGGTGSDTFEVGGTNDGLPVAVESRDLRGYNGLILNSVETVDPAYAGAVVDGISANVADNEVGNVILTPLGLMRVTEGSTTYAQYSVRLSKLPAHGNVYITVSPSELTADDIANGALGLSLVDPSTGLLVPSLVLVFNASNWETGQIVRVAAAADNAPEGAQKQLSEFFTPAAGTTQLTLQHSPLAIEYVKVNGAKLRLSETTLSGSTLALPSTAAGAAVEVAYLLYDGPISYKPIKHSVREDSSSDFVGSDIPLMVVEVVDGSSAGNSVGVVTTPSAETIAAGGTATVTEGGAGTTYSVGLTSAPTADVTVTVTGDGQVLLDGLVVWQHTFTAGDWATRTIALTAPNDGVREGTRTSVLRTTVSSADTTDGPGRFDSTTVRDIEVRVLDANTAGIVIRQSGGSTDVVEGSTTGDTFNVTLTQRPASDVTVVLTATPTLFGNHLVGATSTRTLSFSSDGTLATLRLTFTHDDWAPKTVTVYAVDDSLVNGDGVQVFAPKARSLDEIRGPLNIQGGDDSTADTVIPTPVMFIHESLGGPFVPDANANLVTVETEQTDVLQVLNSDSLADDTGVLTGSRIYGLGMGPDRQIGDTLSSGGVTYGDIELLRLDLGKGNDRLRIDSTHGGITIVNAGVGDDRADVRTVAGPTTINGGTGNDTVNVGTNFTGSWPDGWNHAVSTPAGTLDRIRSFLRVDGGAGTDTLNVDDSGDLTSDVAILTGSTIDGLDLGSSPVQTVELQHADGGTFALHVGASITTTALSFAASAAELRAALLALHVAHVTDVVVNRAGNTFTIGFVGDEILAAAGLSIAVDASGLHYDGSLSPTGGPVVVVRSWGTGLAQTVDVRGAGSYLVTVGAGAASSSFAVSAAMSADAFYIALKAAIRTVDPTLISAEGRDGFTGDWAPGVKDILVDKVGSSFFVTYQGLLRGTVADAFALHIEPNSNATPTVAGAADVTLNAVGGTFTLSSGGARTYALASDAAATDIAAALNALLGTGTVGVSRSGSVLHITGLGAAALTVNDENLVNPLAVAVRRSGIGYQNIEVLNIDFGSGNDVANIRGTSAITNVFGHDGNERFYISSLANETLASAQTTDLLLGNLDAILGNLNIDAAAGRHLLFVSDEAAVAGDTNVSITDHPASATRLPGSEIEIGGLAPAPIDYQAGTAGNFADGITVWSGYGNDTITVDGTHERGGVRTITTLNTGLGDDHVTVNLTAGQDGFFVLNTQGPYNQFLSLSDKDTVDANASTLPLVIFGGQDNDVINGGGGGDIVFGDRGRVLYFDPARGAPGAGRTDAQLEAFAVGVLGHGGPGDKTDGVTRLVSYVTRIDPSIGGNDTITDGLGADVVIGGFGSDSITTNRGETPAAPDADAIVIGDNGFVDYAAIDGNPTKIDRISTTDPTLGGVDTITTGAGYDFVFGGTAGDIIDSGAGNDLVFGDHGRLVALDSRGVDARLLPLATLSDAFSFTSIDTLATDGGGADRIHAGDGQDIVLGGQGADWIWGQAGDDDIIGGHNVAGGNDTGDVIDGGSGNDAIAGDNAIILRRGDAQSPRFRTLPGGTLYDGNGNVLVDAGARPSPDGVAGRDITILDHSVSIESSRTDLYGADYIAGGAGDDVIFGGLGNDTIQGDGSVDSYFTGSPVGASRTSTGPNDPLGPLTLSPSFDAASDGNDYVEGGGGNDVIFGNQGQDDLIGGSSSQFGLGTKALRPDGSDTIFGGSGTAISLDNAGAADHGRDSDAILGDNGNIFRVVTAVGAYSQFTYDNYAGQKIVVRALELLDYTQGGPDYNGTTDPTGVLATNRAAGGLDVGAADEIHGESGDDFIYGQVGNDRLFGDGQNDTIVGGYGADWISGGTGDDGILGDDGRILASRVGQTEPLNGVTVVPPQNVEISIQGGAQDVMTNVTGTLLYTADLTPDNLDPSNAVPSTTMPRPVAANDIIYGGLGNDSIHGGAGDDAISGAEALAESYTNNYNQAGAVVASFLRSDFGHPYNPGNVLGYSPTKTYQAQYDPNDPFREVKLMSSGALWKGGTGFDWLLNFDATRGPLDTYWAASGGVPTDGSDIIFGDLGNDWLVGGTGRDTMWGGWGNDYLNADDVLTTNAGLNTGTDTNASYEDFAYGGAGVDVLVANTGGDRLIDWAGEWDSYLVPFSPFGMATVSRNPSPGLQDLLLAFAKSQGADQTLASVHGGDVARNGEPWGELGMVTHADAAWGDQNGKPRDPQPGNSHGARDVLRSSGTKPIGSGSAATAWVYVAPLAAPLVAPPAAPVAPPVPPPGAFASIDPTIVTSAYVNLANRSAVSVRLGGPVGATITYALTDGVHSVGGTVVLDASGFATVILDASTLADGSATVNAFYVDINGYTNAATAGVVKDTRPPTVALSLQAPPTTNSGWYDVGAVISLTFSGSDGISATLDGSAISSGSLDLDTLVAGAHTIVVRGFDVAGNVTIQSITFQVHATLAGLLAAVKDGARKGFITAAELTTLTSLLQQAMNGNSGRIKLPAFTAEVKLQSGKAITAGYAALLLNWAADLQIRL